MGVIKLVNLLHPPLNLTYPLYYILFEIDQGLYGEDIPIQDLVPHHPKLLHHLIDLHIDNWQVIQPQRDPFNLLHQIK